MAIPRPPITSPGFPSGGSDIAGRVDRGQYVRTNRDNHGAERGYLNSIRRVPNYTAGNATFFETFEDRAKTGAKPTDPVSVGPIGGRPVKPLPRKGGRSAQSATPAGRYDAAQEIPAGTPQANYAAGLRSYGAGMRSAPNVGPVRNKAGYNERDQRIAARNSRANLATGDEQSRVRLLGG